MLKISLLVIFSILLFTFATYGQDCGHGTYTIKFIPKSKFDFKLFSLVPQNIPENAENSFSEFHKWLSTIFPQTGSEFTYCCNITQIKRKTAEDFLKSYKKENFWDFKQLTNLPNKLEGNSETDSINFKTFETQSYPNLLRISSKKYGQFYFLGAFLGGCNRTNTFDLSKNRLIK